MVTGSVADVVEDFLRVVSKACPYSLMLSLYVDHWCSSAQPIFLKKVPNQKNFWIGSRQKDCYRTTADLKEDKTNAEDSTVPYTEQP